MLTPLRRLRRGATRPHTQTGELPPGTRPVVIRLRAAAYTPNEIHTDRPGRDELACRALLIARGIAPSGRA
ncbi:hypothetical protein [Streptomyces hydrogenans]|uniref:hypothetical protein n=1 Tax=Streptomyces hydrogenans TaxID=1873719 RepID=UPI003824DF8B